MGPTGTQLVFVDKHLKYMQILPKIRRDKLKALIIELKRNEHQLNGKFKSGRKVKKSKLQFLQFQA